jgi:cathepsin E
MPFLKDAFRSYAIATGGVLDPVTGLLKITPGQFSNLRSLFFRVEFQNYEFTPNAQIWPRQFNNLIGGSAGGIYLIVADVSNVLYTPETSDLIMEFVWQIGTPSGQGLDFINGYVFQYVSGLVFTSSILTVASTAYSERYYVVCDTTNHRVGFAKTNFTSATSN